MPDREKVIKAWETVLSRDPLDVAWDLIDDTITLLKEQEPVVRCKDCMHQNWVNAETGCIVCKIGRGTNAPDWYCADGEKR